MMLPFIIMMINAIAILMKRGDEPKSRSYFIMITIS